MKKIVITIALVLKISISLFAQHEGGSREVIITKDTTYECNDLRKGAVIVETGFIDGLQLYVFDNPYGVGDIVEMKGRLRNGLYFSFYYSTNMPEQKGYYWKSRKDKEWFYWNKKGVLIKKEIWRRGKLVKRIKIDNK